MITHPLSVAVAGIGGFATAHHESLWQLEKEGVLRVVATCDPKAPDLTESAEAFRFEERGVAVYTDFEAMLAAHRQELHLITLATPIRLHAPMHRACVEAGIACYLEKPPTLDPAELEAMIATDQRAAHATMVGFNYIYQPFRLELKRRLLSGEFGALLRVGYEGLWPRSEVYYQRNNWAGRLLIGDHLLLDSCCGNAMSHHLHNILFFAGDEAIFSWSSPAYLEAELYRANRIEGVDTVFAKGVLRNGVGLRLACSHAVTGKSKTCEMLVFEKAHIAINLSAGRYTIHHEDGRIEEKAIDLPTVTDNLRLYIDYLMGTHQRPTTLLSDCRPLIELNALLYLAAEKITPLPNDAILRVRQEGDTATTCSIPGLAIATERMLAEGELPTQQGLPWASPGGSATVEELPHLLATVQQMAAASLPAA